MSDPRPGPARRCSNSMLVSGGRVGRKGNETHHTGAPRAGDREHLRSSNSMSIDLARRFPIQFKPTYFVASRHGQKDSELDHEQPGPLRPEASQSSWSQPLERPSRAIEFKKGGHQSCCVANYRHPQSAGRQVEDPSYRQPNPVGEGIALLHVPQNPTRMYLKALVSIYSKMPRNPMHRRPV